MTDESELKPCSYYLVRYVPHAERDEFLNIGVLLHSPDDQFLDCLFTDDFRRIRRFHPQADLALLRELQGHFEEQIQEHEENLPGLLEGMQQSLSHTIQLADERTVLSSEPQMELQHLFERLVGSRRLEFPATETRMRVKRQLTDALRHAQVFAHPLFERHIPAERLTSIGDPFHFDFGYRPPFRKETSGAEMKLIHALSLRRDHELASVLALTMRYVRARHAAELTAVVEALPTRKDTAAGHSHSVLRDAAILVQPVSEVNALAAAIRQELTG